MNNEKLYALIAKLNEKTIAKQVIWSKSSGNEEFKLSLKTGPITIQRSEQRYSPLTIGISIYNLDGDLIENYQVNDGHENFPIAEELFINVRRAFYKVDETLDDILTQLETDEVIGNIHENDEEDLPF